MDTGVGTERSTARPPVAGLLLTGGASRRMGRDKASIVLADGRTCAQTVAARLAEVADPLLEIGPGTSGLTAVPDDCPGAGPLAALATGWAALVSSGHSGPVLVLACDLPRVTVPLLELLARAAGDGAVVPVVGERPNPSVLAMVRPRSTSARGWWPRAGVRSWRCSTPPRWSGWDPRCGPR